MEHDHHQHADHADHGEKAEELEEAAHAHEAHEEMQEHAAHEGHEGHADHHEMMVQDFRRRFWVCLVVTVPILALSPMIQGLLGLEALQFPGDSYVLLALSTFVYFYGGWPFLTGLFSELPDRQPGMMTLIAVVITCPHAIDRSCHT